MDFCRKKDISPFNCVVVSRFTLPPYEKYDECLDAVATCMGKVIHGCEYVLLFDIDGALSHDVLLQFESDAAYKLFFKDVVDRDFRILIEDISYHVYSVWDRHNHEVKQATNVVNNYAAQAPKDQVLHRKLSDFTGAEKPAKGEVDIYDWLLEAREMIEHDTHMADEAKVQAMRNSMKKSALALIASKDIRDPKKFMEFISTAYGAANSADHLWFQFYQMKQKQEEKASVYLQRIQTEVRNIQRIDPEQITELNRKKIIFRQFSQGLRQGYSDLLALHLNLKDYRRTNIYPDDGDLLGQVLGYEQERKERFERNEQPQAISASCAATTSLFPIENVSQTPVPVKSETQTFTPLSKMEQELEFIKKQLAQLVSGKKSKKKQEVYVAAVGANQGQPHTQPQSGDKGQGTQKRIGSL